MDTLYNWYEVPDWVNYIARDENGELWYYQKRPVIYKNSWDVTKGKFEFVSATLSQCPEWKASLEKRRSQDVLHKKNNYQ